MDAPSPVCCIVKPADKAVSLSVDRGDTTIGTPRQASHRLAVGEISNGFQKPESDLKVGGSLESGDSH